MVMIEPEVGFKIINNPRTPKSKDDILTKLILHANATGDSLYWALAYLIYLLPEKSIPDIIASIMDASKCPFFEPKNGGR
jgi:hypothetical protein